MFLRAESLEALTAGAAAQGAEASMEADIFEAVTWGAVMHVCGVNGRAGASLAEKQSSQQHSKRSLIVLIQKPRRDLASDLDIYAVDLDLHSRVKT